MEATTSADTSKPTKPRWYSPTPAKFLFAVLVMQGVLFLSAHYRWFWFNERKGYTVLITVGASAVCLLLLGTCLVASWFLKAKAQFSLTTLLLVVPVLAIPCAWLAREVELARQQTAAVNALLARKAVPSCRGYPDAKDTHFVTNLKPPEEYGRLASIFGRDFFAEIFFVYIPEAKDADLLMLVPLTQLELVNLVGSKVTQEGIDRLKAALPNCKILR